MGCGSCIKTGECFIQDKVNEFLAKSASQTDGFHILEHQYILQQVQGCYHLYGQSFLW